MSKLDRAVSRLENIASRLQAVFKHVDSNRGKGRGAANGGDVPVQIEEYDQFYVASVQPFVNASAAFSETKAISKYASSAFKHTRLVLLASFSCKKPLDMMKFLQPCVDAIVGAGKLPGRKKDPFFHFHKSFAEGIQCLNFLLMPRPCDIIKAQLDAADFYLISIQRLAKKQDAAKKAAFRTYVNTLKALLKGLLEYISRNFKRGVQWQANVRNFVVLRLQLHFA